MHVFLDVPSMCTNFQGGLRVFLVDLVWNEVNEPKSVVVALMPPGMQNNEITRQGY